MLMTYLQKYVSNKTKNVNTKLLNMTTNKNEAKAMVKHISCDRKLQIQYYNMEFKSKME